MTDVAKPHVYPKEVYDMLDIPELSGTVEDRIRQLLNRSQDVQNYRTEVLQRVNGRRAGREPGSEEWLEINKIERVIKEIPIVSTTGAYWQGEKIDTTERLVLLGQQWSGKGWDDGYKSAIEDNGVNIACWRATLETLREYPDFDGESVLGEMIDEALAGKVPKVLGAMQRLAELGTLPKEGE